MATKLWVGTDSGNEGDWATAANWSPSGVPVDADDVYFVNSSQSVTEGWSQGTVTLTSLNIAQSFTGYIGDTSNYLTIGASTVRIGYHFGRSTANGSGRLKLDLDDDADTAATVTIYNSSVSPADTDQQSIRLKTVNASTVVRVVKGLVAIAPEPGETSTLGSVYVDYDTSENTDSNVIIESGVTLTNLYTTGGETVLRCAVTTLDVQGGIVTTDGSGAITTINNEGGTIYPNSTGTITTLNLKGGDTDFMKSSAARTVTNFNVYAGARYKIDDDIITLTNGIVLQEAMQVSTSAV